MRLPYLLIACIILIFTLVVESVEGGSLAECHDGTAPTESWAGFPSLQHMCTGTTAPYTDVKCKCELDRIECLPLRLSMWRNLETMMRANTCMEWCFCKVFPPVGPKPPRPPPLSPEQKKRLRQPKYRLQLPRPNLATIYEKLGEEEGQNSCSSSCSSYASCSGSRTQPGCEGAVCVARRTPQERHFSLGNCVALASLGGKRKRSLAAGDISCYCNSTYVAQSCCHEPSGIVHGVDGTHLSPVSLAM